MIMTGSASQMTTSMWAMEHKMILQISPSKNRVTIKNHDDHHSYDHYDSHCCIMIRMMMKLINKIMKVINKIIKMINKIMKVINKIIKVINKMIKN